MWADKIAQCAEQNVGQGVHGQQLFPTAVEVWLADLDPEDKVAPSTRALCARNVEIHR